MNVAPSFNSEIFQTHLLVKDDPLSADCDALQLPENCLSNLPAVGYQMEKLTDLYDGGAAPAFAGGDHMG